MQKYHGSCHCGKVSFEFQSKPIEKGLRCNCSICKRKGAMMTPEAYALDKIKIKGQENLNRYQFGDEVAKHYSCKHCGIYPFHETMRMPGHYRFNLGCIDTVDTFTLEADMFDGKSL